MNMRHPFCFVLGLTLLAAATSSRAAESETLPENWKHQDIGAVEVKGGAALAQGVFTLNGTLDTWGTNDGFHFVWQPCRR